MTARANKLEPQIKSLDDSVACVQDRMEFIEEVKLLKEHLNTVIKKVNDIQPWLDNLVDKDNNDWRCYGEFGFADNGSKI